MKTNYVQRLEKNKRNQAKKKSAFQKRLEEAAKQKGYNKKR